MRAVKNRDLRACASGRVNATAMAAVYPKSDFSQQPATISYRCPAGQQLPFVGEGNNRGRIRHYYYYAEACTAFTAKAWCTRARCRRLSRMPNEAVVERQAARVSAKPEALRRCKAIVEHVLGIPRLCGHEHVPLPRSGNGAGGVHPSRPGLQSGPRGQREGVIAILKKLQPAMRRGFSTSTTTPREAGQPMFRPGHRHAPENLSPGPPWPIS